MESSRLVPVVVWTMLWTAEYMGVPTGANTVKLNKLGLTEVPWDNVTAATTTLFMTNNKLTLLDWAPPGLGIQKLYMQYNKLREFPDLTNLSTTLKSLSIGFNRVTSISPVERLTVLVKLERLLMRRNPLVALPSPTLLPPPLNELNIVDTRSVTLPNFCQLDPSGSSTGKLFINLKLNSFDCDQGGLVWAKLAYNAGILTNVRGATTEEMPVCDKPASMNGLSIENLAEDTIIANESPLRYRRFTRLTELSQFYCYPTVCQTYTGVTKLNCGDLCMKTTGCAMFATDGGNCTITEFSQGVFGTQADFLAFSDWYLI